MIAHEEEAERERLAAVARAEELEAKLAEAERAREEANLRIAALEAELARRGGPSQG